MDHDAPEHGRSRPEATSPWQASLQLASVGVELSGIVAGMTAIGYWLDYWLGLSPVLLIVGAVVGILGGLYRTVRKVMPPRRR